jgi:hypothetical protein
MAKLRSDFAGLRLRSWLAAGARAGDSGGAIAPTTIHTYRKATVFGRIEAESPQDLHGQIRGLGAESPVFRGLGICGANS